MKKTAFCIAAYVLSCAALGSAKAQEPDSLIVERLSEAIVSVTSAPKDAPFAISKVTSTELSRFSAKTQELPFLLSRTPGVVSWGDNGLGTGTTYLRIRGAAGSRINVTMDGVPLNSPEDQTVFWANMNSYSSLLGGIEIQRGIGSSTNGDGAFGGTISLMTRNASATSSAQVEASYGSYNTWKTGFNISTGIIGGKLILDGGAHTTMTDGYLHGTDGNSGNATIGATLLMNDRLILKYRNIYNFEHTGQVWSGVDSGDLLDGNYGEHSGIFGYKDLYNAGLGRYNCLYEYYTRQENGSYTFTPYLQKTTDNFSQDHNILSLSWEVSDLWSATAALHYTYGEGYYSEFRPDNKLSKFGLSFTKSDGSTLSKTDFIREKGLAQHTYGIVANALRRSERSELRLGISAQNFQGNHYGHLTYVADSELADNILTDGSYKYYDSDATKTDLSAFAKYTYDTGIGLSFFGDLQYRFVGYRTDGNNDKFYKNEDGTYRNQPLNIDKKYSFLNPKAGLRYRIGIFSAFASVAYANREPERNNFTDNGSYPSPVPERLLDYEMGYVIESRNVQTSLTLYHMDYRDQFVQTGELSDIGEALTTNIARSYRTGAEISANVKATRWLDINANAALSQNKVLDFDEVVEDWDNGSRTFHYDNSPLAFSPSAVLGGGFSLHFAGFKAGWYTSYISKQYLDNTGNDSRSLPGYTTTDIDLIYTLTPKVGWMRYIEFGVALGNIFNSHHACSGWVYSAICESAGHSNDNRYTQIGYFPSAGFTAQGSIRISF